MYGRRKARVGVQEDAFAGNRDILDKLLQGRA